MAMEIIKLPNSPLKWDYNDISFTSPSYQELRFTETPLTGIAYEFPMGVPVIGIILCSVLTTSSERGNITLFYLFKSYTV